MILELKKVLEKTHEDIIKVAKSTEYVKGYEKALSLFHGYLLKYSDSYNLHIQNRQLRIENNNLKSDNKVLLKRVNDLKEINQSQQIKLNAYESIEDLDSRKQYKKGIGNSLLGMLKKGKTEEVIKILESWIK